MVGPIKPDIAPILAIQKQQLIADPNKQHAGNLIQAAQIAGVSSKAANAKGKDSDVNTPNRSHAASQMTSGQDTEIKHIGGTNFGPGYFDITKRTENC
ncbi:Hypothetical predicted protein [Olea europaea subsp. europaea]|uniref:Uncharacterized protein n=1 Tax=Olea europaea subsp. europaea TaxID=158383 RepID=A0A8S0V656_OLEEU|nr:Hypothetical predicted protein [Olea europaea subsp. europaea]